MSLAFDVNRWWPAPLLPRQDGRDLALLFVVAALSFLAGLAAVGALAGAPRGRGLAHRADRLGHRHRARPRDRDRRRGRRARRRRGLRRQGRRRGPRAGTRPRPQALIAPWIGSGGLPPDLPTPRLVAIDLDRKAPATGAAIAAALKAHGVDADVDDHSRWSAQIMRAGAATEGVALAIFALIVAVLGAVVAFATRQGLAARHDVVEALHLAGATDGYIARLFQARFARSAAQASLAGAALAAIAAAALKASTAGDDAADRPAADRLDRPRRRCAVPGAGRADRGHHRAPDGDGGAGRAAVRAWK